MLKQVAQQGCGWPRRGGIQGWSWMEHPNLVGGVSACSRGIGTG